MFANVDDDEEVDEDEIGDDAEEEDGNDAEKGDEVLRRNKREVCGTKYRFTRAQITAVINSHNKMRALEGAADMMRIVSRIVTSAGSIDYPGSMRWQHFQPLKSA